MTGRLWLVMTLFVLLVPAWVASHDMWLVPLSEAPRVGERVEVQVSVGMDFPNSEHAIDPERLEVTLRGPSEKTPRVEVEKQEDQHRTLARFLPDAAGVWILGAATRPKVLEMEASEFNHYLLHDGLPHVLAERIEAGELEKNAREQYSKFTKAILTVGDASDGGKATKLLGHTLEIIPLRDPNEARVGETLAVRVLYRGEPLARANLCWDHPGNGELFSGQVWTGDDGGALVPIARAGLMTLRLIHMTRPRTEAYEWESFWASCTFWISNP